MSEISQSPTPRPKKIQIPETSMNFYDALKEVVDNNKKIHKLEWKDKEFYVLLKDEVLTLHKPDEKFYQLVLNNGDIQGTDWIVIK